MIRAKGYNSNILSRLLQRVFRIISEVKKPLTIVIRVGNGAILERIIASIRIIASSTKTNS